MSNIIREIIIIVLSAIVFEISNRLYKKYKIKERKLTLLVAVLLCLGLFLIIFPLILLLAGFQRGDILFSSVLVFSSAMFAGALLLIFMVWIIIRKEEIFPEDPGMLKIPKGTFLTTVGSAQAKAEKPPASGRALAISGFLLFGACVILFIAFGPQNDPPGMSPEHIQTDMYINYLCGSVAFIGLMLLFLGLWKSFRKPRTPPVIYLGSDNSTRP